MKKTKKGISPLIAAVLLIAFTVAIATLAMGWFSQLTRTTTTTVSNKTTEAVACSNAQVSIDGGYLRLNATESDARVLVKNSGFSNLGITSLQVYNTTGANFSTGFGGASSLTPGSLVAYNITMASIPTCATFSKVIVTTNCGGVTDVFESTPTLCQ